MIQIRFIAFVCIEFTRFLAPVNFFTIACLLGRGKAFHSLHDVRLSVCLSFSTCFVLFVLSVCFVCLSLCLSCLSFCLVCLPVCLVCISVCLSLVCLSFHRLSNGFSGRLNAKRPL